MLSWLEESVLTLLNSGEQYGLRLLDAIQTTSQKRIGFGSLYPALHRLESKGMVTSRWGDETNFEKGKNAGRRKYYTITPSGKDALEEVRQFRQKLSDWNLTAVS